MALAAFSLAASASALARASAFAAASASALAFSSAACAAAFSASAFWFSAATLALASAANSSEEGMVTARLRRRVPLLRRQRCDFGFFAADADGAAVAAVFLLQVSSQQLFVVSGYAVITAVFVDPRLLSIV